MTLGRHTWWYTVFVFQCNGVWWLESILPMIKVAGLRMGWFSWPVKSTRYDVPRMWGLSTKILVPLNDWLCMTEKTQLRSFSKSMPLHQLSWLVVKCTIVLYLRQSLHAQLKSEAKRNSRSIKLNVQACDWIMKKVAIFALPPANRERDFDRPLFRRSRQRKRLTLNGDAGLLLDPMAIAEVQLLEVPLSFEFGMKTVLESALSFHPFSHTQ